MRSNKMIAKEKMPLSFILSTHSLRKCIEISLENLYVDIGSNSKRLMTKSLSLNRMPMPLEILLPTSFVCFFPLQITINNKTYN